MKHHEQHEHKSHKGPKGHKGLKHRKHGGKTALNKYEYNAVGSPEMHESQETEDGFRHGGHVKKKKHGGKAEGHKAHHRLDKMPRRAAGGSVKHRKHGGSLSNASHISAHETGGAGQGHEGIEVSGDD